MASGASTFGAVPPVDLFLGLIFLPRVSPCWSQGVWAKGGSGNSRRHRGLCVISLPCFVAESLPRINAGPIALPAHLLDLFNSWLQAYHQEEPCLHCPDRIQKLKDARSEAAKEIEEYKASKEAEFKKFEDQVCSNSPSYVT